LEFRGDLDIAHIPAGRWRVFYGRQGWYMERSEWYFMAWSFGCYWQTEELEEKLRKP
jgi:hypothetical protein